MQDLQITMEEPSASAGTYVQFRVERGEEGRVYGGWHCVRGGGDGRPHPDGSEEIKPVLEAWNEAKDYALDHGLRLIYVQDRDCVFDAERLGLTRDPDNDCSASDEPTLTGGAAGPDTPRRERASE